MFANIARSSGKIARALVLRSYSSTAAINGMAESSTHVVGHDKTNSEFYVRLEDGQSSERAILQYRALRPGVLDLYHTHVPVVFRGQGIAKLLAKAALDHVVNEDSKMLLTCTYLQKYAKDHPYPQYTDRIVSG